MTNDDLNKTINNITEAWKYPELYENVTKSERWLSGAAGTYLLFIKSDEHSFVRKFVKQ